MGTTFFATIIIKINVVMKKLSIEEKAKTYDETIERAREDLKSLYEQLKN